MSHDSLKKRLTIESGWLEEHQLQTINTKVGCSKCSHNLSRNFLLLDVSVEFEAHCNHCFKVEGDCIIMEFIFECDLSGLDNKEELRIPARTHNVHFSPGLEQKFRIPETNPSEMMVIILSADLYFRLIPKNTGLLKKFSDNIDLGKACSLFDTYVSFNTWIQSALNDIEKCHYEGELKRLYLENKIQELLLMHFDLYQQYHSNSQTQEINNDNFEKLKKAKSILDTNFVHAPSFRELSKMVYLNEYALKKEFKQCFGTSVKQYIINLRMKYAMDLIKEGRLSITEIGIKCGYNGLVQFSTAFKRYYGQPPSSVSRLSSSV